MWFVSVAAGAFMKLSGIGLKSTSLTILPIVVLTVACAPLVPARNQATPQDRFWRSLHGICDRAFAGRIAETIPPDTSFAGKSLVMHVRSCSDREVRIPFHVGENRSRTWVVTRTPSGLRLKHDHRHADGSEDRITRYGGDTRNSGTAYSQDFYADSLTASLIAAAATNVWTIEVRGGNAFVYALRREGTERRFRVQFDLTRPVAAPPAPWGH